MSNKNYQRGVRAERLLKQQLEVIGYLVIRAAGSHSAFDLVAAHKRSGTVRFIQVKTMKTNPQPLLRKFINTVPLGYWPDIYSQELWIRYKGEWYSRIV